MKLKFNMKFNAHGRTAFPAHQRLPTNLEEHILTVVDYQPDELCQTADGTRDKSMSCLEKQDSHKNNKLTSNARQPQLKPQMLLIEQKLKQNIPQIQSVLVQKLKQRPNYLMPLQTPINPGLQRVHQYREQMQKNSISRPPLQPYKLGNIAPIPTLKTYTHETVLKQVPSVAIAKPCKNCCGCSPTCINTATKLMCQRIDTLVQASRIASNSLQTNRLLLEQVALRRKQNRDILQSA